MKCFPLYLFFVLACAVHAQTPTIEWQRPFGGSGVDCAYSVIETSDGGYMVLGHTNSTDGDISVVLGGLDYWIIKLDRNGYLEWERSYGGSHYEEGYSVVELADSSGYIIGGHTQSADGQVTAVQGRADCWVMRLDRQGNIVWQRTFGGSEDDLIYSPILPTADGGFIFLGTSSSLDGDRYGSKGASDAWLVKLSSTGALEWEKSYGGSDGDHAYSIKPTPDGGYVFCARTRSVDGDVLFNHGDFDGWIVKLNSNGDMEWQRTYGGSLRDELYSITVTPEGEFTAAGYSQSVDGDVQVAVDHSYDYWILKVSTTGDIIWSKTYGGTNLEWATCIHATTVDSGYILSGSTRSGDGDVTGYHGTGARDGWVVKLDQQGHVVWESAFGGSLLDEAYDIKQTSDGGFVFTGSTYSSDGDVIVKPPFHDPDTTSDFWVVKLAGPQCGDKILQDWLRNGTLEPFTIIAQTPGPVVVDRFNVKYLVRSPGNVSVRIYNALGEIVSNVSLGDRTNGQYTSPITVGSLPSGVYTYHFELNGFVVPGRFIINR